MEGSLMKKGIGEKSFITCLCRNKGKRMYIFILEEGIKRYYEK